MDADVRPLTVGEWMLTLLVLAIPLVNLIMYIYWAVADGVNLNRKRFCQASIFWFLILMGLSIGFMVIAGIFGGLFAFL
jgi:hypothetical protein